MSKAQELKWRPQRIEPRAVATLTLIVLNVAVFIAQNLINHADPGGVYRNFALSADGLKHGCVWQLLTFQFLHLPLERGGVFHLLGNLFMIHVFGRPVEMAMGRGRFLGLYLLSGTVGGLLQTAGGLLAPAQFGVAVVGASAGVFGLMAAFTTLFPRRTLHLFFSPVSFRADWFFTACVAATLVGLFLPSGQVAHCAHLGGILTGFSFARQFVLANQRAAPAGSDVKSPLKITTVRD